MNIIKLYGGLALVVIGAILLFMAYLKWLSGNWVLLLGLFFIVAGCVDVDVFCYFSHYPFLFWGGVVVVFWIGVVWY